MSIGHQTYKAYAAAAWYDMQFPHCNDLDYMRPTSVEYLKSS